MKYPYKQETQHPCSRNRQKAQKNGKRLLTYIILRHNTPPTPFLLSTAAMPAAASDDNDTIRTGERDEAVEGVDDSVWDVFDYFGEL